MRSPGKGTSISLWVLAPDQSSCSPTSHKEERSHQRSSHHRNEKQRGLLCLLHLSAWTSLFLHSSHKPVVPSPAFLINFSRSPLAWSMTSLHLQHFIVQMSLANLAVFGQSCTSSLPEILPPSPSLIRLWQRIQRTQLLFLRKTPVCC